jgi:hypothetical protein
MPRTKKPKKPDEPQVLLPDYSDEIVDKILARISDGDLLMQICREPGMPTRSQFYRWMVSRPAMRDSYARARLAFADWHAESIIALVTDPKGNYIDQNGSRLPLTHEEVGARRLHVESVKWLVGKWAPRTYGDGGAGQGAIDKPEPVQGITRRIIYPKDTSELPGPPLQLTYDPGPLPDRLDQDILARVIRAVKDNVPKADQRDPREILDEVMTTIVGALKAKYADDDVTQYRPATLEERIEKRSLNLPRTSRSFV